MAAAKDDTRASAGNTAMDSPTAIRGQVRFLAVMAGCNVVSPLIALGPNAGEPGAFLMAVFAGMVAGQIGALSVWLVWSAGGLWSRVLQVVVAAAILVASALVGVWVGPVAGDAVFGPESRHMFQAASVICLVIPPVSLAVQAPLWLCRLVFGWRIVHERDQSSEPPLSIRDLLSGTALVAITLGCMRLLLLTPAAPPPQEAESGYWISWGISALILTGVSTLLILPLVAIVLRPPNSEAAVTGGCGFTVGAVVLVCLAVGILSASYGGRGPPGEFFVILAALVFSSLATVAVPLYMARSQGFRLVIGRHAKTTRVTA